MPFQTSAFSVQRSAFSVQRSAFSVQRSAFSVPAFADGLGSAKRGESLERVAFKRKHKKLPLATLERVFCYAIESDKTQHALEATVRVTSGAASQVGIPETLALPPARSSILPGRKGAVHASAFASNSQRPTDAAPVLTSGARLRNAASILRLLSASLQDVVRQSVPPYIEQAVRKQVSLNAVRVSSARPLVGEATNTHADCHRYGLSLTCHLSSSMLSPKGDDVDRPGVLLGSPVMFFCGEPTVICVRYRRRRSNGF